MVHAPVRAQPDVQELEEIRPRDRDPSAKLDKLQALGYYKIMKVRSKHNDLMNYFIVDHKYLSKQYIRKYKKL